MSNRLKNAFRAFGEGYSQSSKNTAEQREYRRQENLNRSRTPLPVSPETCWFCGRNASLAPSEAKVQMYSNERSEGGRRSWEQHFVSVPRCETCFRVHKVVRRARLAGCLIGAAFIMPWHVPRDSNGVLILVLGTVMALLLASVPLLLLSILVLRVLRIKVAFEAQRSPYVHNYAISQKTGLLRYGSPATDLLNFRVWMNRVCGGWVQ